MESRTEAICGVGGRGVRVAYGKCGNVAWMAAERGRRLYLRWYTAAVGLSRQAPDEACGEQGEDDDEGIEAVAPSAARRLAVIVGVGHRMPLSAMYASSASPRPSAATIAHSAVSWSIDLPQPLKNRIRLFDGFAASRRFIFGIAAHAPSLVFKPEFTTETEIPLKAPFTVIEICRCLDPSAEWNRHFSA